MRSWQRSPATALFNAPVIALGVVLLHYEAPDFDLPGILRSTALWLSILGLGVVLPTVAVTFVLLWRRARPGAGLSPERRRRAYKLIRFQTMGNALLIPLAIVAVLLVGTPWWAVLVTAWPTAAGLVYLLRAKPPPPP